MNKLQEAIAKLEAETDRNELNEKLLQMLQEKERELGDNLSEEEAEQAVSQVIKEHFMFALRRSFFHEDDGEKPDPWDDEMEDNMDVIRGVFNDMDLHYREYVHQKGVHACELGVTAAGKSLRMKVYLEAETKVCRIDAIYPFLAERVFAYPLCEKMAEENFPRRFGALQYDSRDNELSYRYSFPISHGLHEDVFRTVFFAIVTSANASYDVIKQYAIGRFRKPIRDSITCTAQNLIIELDL